MTLKNREKLNARKEELHRRMKNGETFEFPPVDPAAPQVVSHVILEKDDEYEDNVLMHCVSNVDQFLFLRNYLLLSEDSPPTVANVDPTKATVMTMAEFKASELCTPDGKMAGHIGQYCLDPEVDEATGKVKRLKPSVDTNWERRVMPVSLIAVKHIKKLRSAMREAIEADDKTKIKNLSEEYNQVKLVKDDKKFWYKKAIKNMDDQNLSKPSIRAKINKHIQDIDTGKAAKNLSEEMKKLK